MDRLISEIATQQHGVVGRAQLTGMGVSRGAVEGRLARGQLHRVHRGAYSAGHRLLSLEGRWFAAVISVGDEAVLSHRSAGRLWRLLPRTQGIAEVTSPRSWRPRPGIVVHCSHVPADERRVVDGIPVTSVPRTVFDSAADMNERQIEQMLNETEVQGLTDELSVWDLIARYPGRRGVAKLRTVLAAQAPGGITRSELEERFVVFLDAHGLPRPRLNADLALRGRFFEVDCLWAEQRLIVELDGRAAHGTARAFENDRERDRLLIAEGWRVVRVTWRQLRDDAGAVAADLRRLLVPSSLAA